jgi:hypothetical protein
MRKNYGIQGVKDSMVRVEKDKGNSIGRELLSKVERKNKI